MLEMRKFLRFECNVIQKDTESDWPPAIHGQSTCWDRILAKITADGVFVEELEHNPEPWPSQKGFFTDEAVH